MSMNERAQILLKTLVERYIADGQPVGSRSLSRFSGLELSPASIRNVMADLEEMGLITSPHTSAGRVPTVRGYRLFVDSLLTVRPLDRVEVGQMEENLSADSLHGLVSTASSLLSELTRFAGVVVTARRSPVFRHVEFLRLSERRVLLIIVTPDGDVQNRVLLTERDYSPAELTRAGNFLTQQYGGLTLEEIVPRLQEELARIKDDMTGLLSAALEASQDALAAGGDDFVISGEGNLLRVDDLSTNIAKLRSLFDLFEEKSRLMQLLQVSTKAQGVQLFIGSESGITHLDDCSVISAPYRQEGQVVGTVAVVGPTRMAYERVIPIVDMTARLLSSALSRN